MYENYTTEELLLMWACSVTWGDAHPDGRWQGSSLAYLDDYEVEFNCNFETLRITHAPTATEVYNEPCRLSFVFDCIVDDPHYYPKPLQVGVQDELIKRLEELKSSKSV